jgi:putative SOS response-associated peptidase YedK
MCGRYYRRSDKQRIAEAFKVGKLPPGFELPPDYNIAPSIFQPVIRTDRETGERELTMMRWGLVPTKVADPTASRSSPLQMRDRNRFSKRVSGKDRSLILVAWFHLTASTSGFNVHRDLSRQSSQANTVSSETSREYRRRQQSPKRDPDQCQIRDARRSAIRSRRRLL